MEQSALQRVRLLDLGQEEAAHSEALFDRNVRLNKLLGRYGVIFR